MIKIDIYQVKIEPENRGSHGIYGNVFCRCPIAMRTEKFYDWTHILTLPPGVKLTKSMFYEALTIK